MLDVSYSVTGSEKHNNLSVRLCIIANGVEISLPMKSEGHAISVIMAMRDDDKQKTELFALAGDAVYAWDYLSEDNVEKSDTVKFLFNFYRNHKNQSGAD